MASVTSAAVTIPSFTGLKTSTASSTSTTRLVNVSLSTTTKVSTTKAALMTTTKASSLKDFSLAIAATAASALLASNAMAIEVLLGSDDGALAFVPNAFSVAPGEKIVFKNNAGFPHNIVFDEDEVPAGVDVSKISMSEEDLLNAPGETYAVTLSEKGTYTFYCAPHQGAGMVGKVTVN